MAVADREASRSLTGWVFFDRSVIDAAAALKHLTGVTSLATLAAQHRYNSLVFLTPPWPEIYINDPERRHGFDEAVAEYERLLKAFPAAGYSTCILPQVPVGERADFIIAKLSELKP